MYRNNNNNNPNESLPPSPKSQQQSCFNSPLGSPGPHSISTQDINPFNYNGYESMAKICMGVDLINLETTQQSTYNNPFNNSNTIDNINNDNQSKNILSSQCSQNLADKLNYGQHINSNSQLMQHSNGNRYLEIKPFIKIVS
jgi:hypothetical protein